MAPASAVSLEHWLVHGAVIRGRRMTHRQEPPPARPAQLPLPWRILCFIGRMIRSLFVVMGVLAALAVVGYVEFESIVEAIDTRYAAQIDRWLGTDKAAIARLD